MQYSLATSEEDRKACEECVMSTGYYSPVSFEDLGGFVLMAKDGDTVVGAVWATKSNKIAFLDYLAVRPGYAGVGPRLLAKLRRALKQLGVLQVRYAIHGGNEAAYKISAAIGGVHDFHYIIGVAQLEAKDGQ